MSPKIFLSTAAFAALAWYLWRRKANLTTTLPAVAVHAVDALLLAYSGYFIWASVFNPQNYESWTGFAHLVFFYEPTGSQIVGALFGGILGYLRFFQPGSKPLAYLREYQGGRRVYCHKVALALSNADLARTAEREKRARPQHLDAKQDYSEWKNIRDESAIEPVSDIEQTLAVTPYQPKEGEIETLLWGMLRIPIKQAERPFLVVGSSGSGKTLMIHALMKSVFPSNGKPPRDFRAFIYDDKPDFIEFAKTELKELSIPVWNFDPFAEDGVAWDIAADILEPADALQVATVLSPIDAGLHEPYFQQSAQALLHAILISFFESGNKEWTLRDVLLSFTSKRRLLLILSRSEESLRIAQPFLGAKRSLDEVLASVRTKLRPYDIVAGLWSKAKVKRSVRQWHKTNAILLVTGRARLSTAVRPINQALFKMAAQLLLSDDDSDCRSSWVFLDEIREIGKLEDFHALANKGRSKGVKMVLGFQSITGLRSAYGEENAADEVANFCGHKTFLNLTCEKTREWAAKHIGTIAVDETVFNYSQTVGQGGRSSSISWQTKREVRQALEPSDFEHNLRPAMPKYGLTAVNIVPHIGTYVSWVPWSWVKRVFPGDRNGSAEGERLRPSAAQKLEDWVEADIRRLNLTLEFLTCAFSASEISDIDVLVEKIRGKANPVAALLHDDFRNVDGSDSELRDLLADRLNRLLVGPCIYDDTEFKKIHLRPETKRRLEQKPTGVDLMLLNRLLFEDALPDLPRFFSQLTGSSGLDVRR